MERVTRRRFLTTTLVSTALAGCAGGDTDTSGGSNGESNEQPDQTEQPAEEKGTPTPKAIGESVAYGGLKMAVTETKMVSEYSDDRGTHTPEQGATFLIANIRVENIGEAEISYPERGGDIQLVYKGRETGDEFVSADTKVEGENITLYSDVIDEKGADAGAYPGTIVEGWVIFELPENFDAGDAYVSIRYIDTSHDSRRFRWVLG